MKELVLYDGGGTPSPRRVKMCLIEKDLPFKIKWLNLALMDQKAPSYLKLNPMGLVPTLVHDGKTIFNGLPADMQVGRYHSLIADPETIPDVLEVSARGDGVVMAVRHKQLPAEGVQFHPESVLTEYGHDLLRNFVERAL